jgi:hypothetical protein
MERECCDLVGACSGPTNAKTCSRALLDHYECVKDKLLESNDTRAGIPSWVRAHCANESEQREFPASAAAATCMLDRCSDVCFPVCPPGAAAESCGDKRRCRLGPSMPSFVGTGCSEKLLEEKCCEVINDCMEDRPCLNTVRCLEKRNCLHSIGLRDPTQSGCAGDCFERGRDGGRDIPIPLLSALLTCVPPSGACPALVPGDAGPEPTGPGDASLDVADAPSE